MKASLGYPLLHHPADPAFTAPEFMAEFARVAEQCGYDARQPHRAPDARRQVARRRWAPCPRSLRRPRGGRRRDDPVRLMTNLTVLPYRNPFLLAKSVASLDRVSERAGDPRGGHRLPQARVLRARRRLRGAQRPLRRGDRGVPLRVVGRERHLRRPPLHRPRQLACSRPRCRTRCPSGSAATPRSPVSGSRPWPRAGCPCGTRREFAATRRSPVLETLDDLETMLDDVRGAVREHRDPGPRRHVHEHGGRRARGRDLESGSSSGGPPGPGRSRGEPGT